MLSVIIEISGSFKFLLYVTEEMIIKEEFVLSCEKNILLWTL